jgi:GMP synthase-like glutamine amidotransferase
MALDQKLRNVLIFQHNDETPPGTTLDWLRTKGVSYHIHHFTKAAKTGAKIPPVSDFDALVICGGGMNVDQEALYPWLRDEKEALREWISSGKRILGLCLGSQLLAEVLGSKAEKHSHWEVGFHAVSLSPEKSKYLPPEIHTLTVFQYHGYRYHCPQKGFSLGTNSACSDQAFQVGENIVAFQFHPESTKEWIVECATDHSEPYPTGEFVEAPEKTIQNLKLQEDLQRWYFHFLDRFFLRKT